MPIRISGAGCCLVDLLYPESDFSSPAFAEAASRAEGDGGLSPGRLVFAEDAARFTGRPAIEAIAAIGGPIPAAMNVGGPSVVSLIHAAQMLEGRDALVSFYGATGDDDRGRELRAMLAKTPLDVSRLETRRGPTPSTFALSDPAWDGGRGERCFVNEIGAAENYLPSELGPKFYEADIVALGGTALVPRIHEGLPAILAAARDRGALTFVNTVFDFRAERRDGVGAWPLGGEARTGSGPSGPGPMEAYRDCDLLLMDRDEALRLSGERELEAALRFFEGSGVGAFVVTRGGDPVLAWAGAGRFADSPLREWPVSDRAFQARVSRRAAEGGAARGDTTGCGDAFAGGILASLARQLETGVGDGLDLADAVSWGIAAGAFTLGILGGTYYESRIGEKRELVAAYREAWLAQAGIR